MPFLTTDDKVQLHYEESGTGTAIIFVHEFAGDHRSWEPQMRFLSAGIAASALPREAIRLRRRPTIRVCIPRRVRVTTFVL